MAGYALVCHGDQSADHVLAALLAGCVAALVAARDEEHVAVLVVHVVDGQLAHEVRGGGAAVLHAGVHGRRCVRHYRLRQGEHERVVVVRERRRRRVSHDAPEVSTRRGLGAVDRVAFRAFAGVRFVRRVVVPAVASGARDLVAFAKQVVAVVESAVVVRHITVWQLVAQRQRGRAAQDVADLRQ